MQPGSREAVRVVQEGTANGRYFRPESALAMTDSCPHATLLLPQFATTLARFLDAHAFLPVVTDREYRERL